SAQATADRLVGRIRSQAYDQAMTLRLLDRISADADDISGQGERAAEQATMALDALFIAYTRNTSLPHSTEIRAAINGLYAQLENPSSYDPRDFSRRLRGVNALLH